MDDEHDTPWADFSAAALFEQLPNGALIIAADGAITAGNAVAAALFEVDASFAGMNVTDLMPEPERQRLNPLVWLQRWANEPTAPELDFVYLTCQTSSGTEKRLRLRVARIDLGAPHYLVLLHDMTQAEARQRAERRAHRIAARTLAISADAVVTVDAEQKIATLNASAETLFGYRAAELIGEPLECLIPDRFHRSHTQHMLDFAAESAPSRLMAERAHVLALTRDGTEVPIEVSITKVSDEEGPVFSAHVRDLRARFAADQAKEESEARFRDVFEHSSDALAVLDLDGRVLEMNPAANALLDTDDPVDIEGQHIAGLPWWSEDREATRQALEQAVELCRQGETYSTRTETVTPSGDRVPLNVSLRPIIRAARPFLILAEARRTDG